jgi:hypothetical protein
MPTGPRLAAIALCAVLAALPVGGCGDDEDGPPPTAATADRLLVTLDDGEGRQVRTPVSCADAPDLCGAVRDILAEPDDRVCTQIYGGPERLILTGTLDGAPLDLVITRTDGCEIDRYDRVVAALPGSDG